MSKRRSFSPEFKAQVILELLSGMKSGAELCRQHRLSPQLLGQWKTIFLERAVIAFQNGEQHSQEATRIAELERLVGRLTLEAEVLKKATTVLQTAPDGNGRW